MKRRKKWIPIFLMAMLLLTPFPVLAIDFDVEELYPSVVVVQCGRAMGSGFAIGEDCLITNAHVIAGGGEVRVSNYGGESYTADIMAMDEQKDLAVLRVLGAALPSMQLAEESVKPGADVYAIGAPVDMPYTITKGIVSAADRVFGGGTYLQVDASINPGNSGGPLVDGEGRVLGVNTMKVAEAEGIALAIPIDEVSRFLERSEITVEDGRMKTDREPIFPAAGDFAQGEGADPRERVVLLSVLAGFLAVVSVMFILLYILERRKLKRILNAKSDYDFEIEIQE